ncbi:tetratricopeptide repeat protein [Dactylosporangium vinaceum]|uniref:Tetratricopeptide repeat protein n=1 Tax=Dactylosporangium vinaceum TaxID=53362 RepID=A0ABV5MNA0_9ACTN|nr:tetratricopeptide repeat protein [Dactylosporangium vinaceum]UAB98561.1 tetratricopeptide repeat protein [Dactylosporangium vinaceum]
MSAVDVTESLDAIERLVVGWDFPGARAEVQRLLDEPGLSDDDRLTARRLLAEVLRELGELDAAYDLAEAVAAQAERRYGQIDPRTVHAVAVLAAVRHDHDEWDEAERLYHRVLDSGIDEDGTDPCCRAVRLARVNLALLQRDRGETGLALAMLNAAYVIHRREYGAEDLDTIRIAAELAALQYQSGDVLQARRLFTLAHAAARARLGTRHPFTKAVEWELAAVEPPMPSAPISVIPTPVVVDPVVPPPAPAPRSAPPPAASSPPPGPAPVSPSPSAASSSSSASSPSSARVMWPLISLVAVLVVGAGVTAGFLLLRDGSPPSAPPVAAPGASVAVLPATASTVGGGDLSGGSEVPAFVVRDLKVQPGGRELVVTWAALPVSVVVALSRAGAPATVLGTVPPGTSRYVVKDIDPAGAYCVVLGPVNETVNIAPATSACTSGR